MDPITNSKDLGASKKRQNQPKNTAVYVSNLPDDITEEEIAAEFSKCGIIMDEILTGKPRIKIYYNEDGSPKGDALVVYLREESVNLALTILDDIEIRPDRRIRVQEASFNKNTSEDQKQQLQEEQNEVNKRRKVDKETWKKHMRRMQKKLEWFDEEGEAQAREATRLARFSKILVLRNMYRPEELHQDPLEFPIQLAEEISEECEEKLGITDCNVQVIEESAEEGMCTVKFKSEIEAMAAAKLMNGRLFAGMRVSATIYDGSFQLPKKQQNKGRTPEEDVEHLRLDAFSKFIENNTEDSESDEEEEKEDNYSDGSSEEVDEEVEIL